MGVKLRSVTPDGLLPRTGLTWVPDDPRRLA